MSWRQVDCKFLACSCFCGERELTPYIGHINNLYNTTFWMMVLKGGMSNTDAEQELKVRFRLVERSAGCRGWLPGNANAN